MDQIPSILYKCTHTLYYVLIFVWIISLWWIIENKPCQNMNEHLILFLLIGVVLHCVNWPHLFLLFSWVWIIHFQAGPSLSDLNKVIQPESVWIEQSGANHSPEGVWLHLVLLGTALGPPSSAPPLVLHKPLSKNCFTSAPLYVTCPLNDPQPSISSILYKCNIYYLHDIHVLYYINYNSVE